MLKFLTGLFIGLSLAVSYAHEQDETCEQYANGDEIINFVEDRRSFVLFDRSEFNILLYSVHGAGTGVMQLIASSSYDSHNFEYGKNSVKLGDKVFTCQ